MEPIPWLCQFQGVSHSITASVCGLISPQQYWLMSYQSGRSCIRDWGDNADETTQPRRTAATTLALIFDVKRLLNYNGLLAEDSVVMDRGHRS